MAEALLFESNWLSGTIPSLLRNLYKAGRTKSIKWEPKMFLHYINLADNGINRGLSRTNELLQKLSFRACFSRCIYESCKVALGKNLRSMLGLTVVAVHSKLYRSNSPSFHSVKPFIQIIVLMISILWSRVYRVVVIIQDAKKKG